MWPQGFLRSGEKIRNQCDSKGIPSFWYTRALSWSPVVSRRVLSNLGLLTCQLRFYLPLLTFTDQEQWCGSTHSGRPYRRPSHDSGMTIRFSIRSRFSSTFHEDEEKGQVLALGLSGVQKYVRRMETFLHRFSCIKQMWDRCFQPNLNNCETTRGAQQNWRLATGDLAY